MPVPTPALDHRFDMNAAVARLVVLAERKRAARPVVDDTDSDAAGPFRLCRIGDLPEPSPEWEQADEALKGFANELASSGGLDRMVAVYDEAAERYGYRAVCGVSASWSGCHGWWH